MADAIPGHLTITQAAQLTGRSIDAIGHLIRRGYVTAVTVPGADARCRFLSFEDIATIRSRPRRSERHDEANKDKQARLYYEAHRARQAVRSERVTGLH